MYLFICLRQRRKLAPGRLPLLVAHRFSIFAFSSAVISGFFLIWKILNFHKIVLFVWFWSLSHLRDLLVPLLLLIPLLLLLLHHVLHLHQLGRPGVNLDLRKKKNVKKREEFQREKKIDLLASSWSLLSSSFSVSSKVLIVAARLVLNTM